MEENTSERFGLEPQQYERMYWEEDIPVKNITKGIGRWLLGMSVLLFAGIVMAAAIIKYPDQIEMPFVLRSDQKGDIYTFPFDVYIREVFVQPGQSVQKGEPLMRIGSPEIAAMLAELSSQSSKSEAFHSFTESAYNRQRDILDKQISQLRTRREQVEKELNLVEARWLGNASTLQFNMNDASERLDADKQLYSEGIVSRQAMQEKQKEFEMATDALDAAETAYKRDQLALETTLRETERDIQSAELEISRLSFEKGARSEELKGDLTASQSLITSVFGNHIVEDGSVILLSPDKAVVSFVFDGAAEIDPGVIALKLNRSHKANYAFVKCPPSYRGKIGTGMKANMKVASFPYYEWGVVEGEVAYASLAPDENGAYNVHLSLDHQNRMEGMLFAGLDGKAVIVLEEKTILEYFFRNLSKVYYDIAEGEFMASE